MNNINNVTKNYWEISEEQRIKEDGPTKEQHQIAKITRKNKIRYWYGILNIFVHICIVLASVVMIWERDINQSPVITVSIFLGSALTLELIYFVLKYYLNKSKTS